jgi:hypothetical protein
LPDKSNDVNAPEATFSVGNGLSVFSAPFDPDRGGLSFRVRKAAAVPRKRKIGSS